MRLPINFSGGRKGNHELTQQDKPAWQPSLGQTVPGIPPHVGKAALLFACGYQVLMGEGTVIYMISRSSYDTI